MTTVPRLPTLLGSRSACDLTLSLAFAPWLPFVTRGPPAGGFVLFSRLTAMRTIHAT